MHQWRRVRFVLAGSCLLLASASGAAKSECSVQNASYVLNADTTFSARFLPVKKYNEGQSLLFVVNSARTGSAYYLGFEVGNRFVPSIVVVPVRNPSDGDSPPVSLFSSASHAPLPMMFFTLNNQLEIQAPTLSSDDVAPEPVFVSNLSENLYYLRHFMTTEPVGLTKERLPLGAFRLSPCHP